MWLTTSAAPTLRLPTPLAALAGGLTTPRLPARAHVQRPHRCGGKGPRRWSAGGQRLPCGCCDAVGSCAGGRRGGDLPLQTEAPRACTWQALDLGLDARGHGDAEFSERITGFRQLKDFFRASTNSRDSQSGGFLARGLVQEFYEKFMLLLFLVRFALLFCVSL